jgi:hypothetical protein
MQISLNISRAISYFFTFSKNFALPKRASKNLWLPPYSSSNTYSKNCKPFYYNSSLGADKYIHPFNATADRLPALLSITF